VLSHTEQLARLLAACPEAVDSALVAGDPTHDRILAGLPWRERYRNHLETGRRKLVLVSSTWGPTSLLGAWPGFLVRLLAELPVDEYRVALALHPNVWHGHGTWQVRAWLAEAERAGLRVLPPRQGWQAALVAADHVIGDHGSVTFYGAAQGTHTMLAAFPHHEMASGSPIAEFGRAATQLRADRPLLPQLLIDAADHTPDRFAPFTNQLNSVPGGSGQILRATFYQLLDLPEPAHPVRVLPPDPPVPYRLAWPRSAKTAPLLATAVNEGPAVRVSRHPEALVRDGSLALYRPHLVVREDEPDPRARDRADLVVCEEGEATVWERMRAALERNRQSALAAAPEQHTCLLLTRDGRRYRLTPQEPLADPEVLASAFWRVRVNHDFAPPALVFAVRVGGDSTDVHVGLLDGVKRSSADHDNRCPTTAQGPRS
jgi:hypothetical protein